MTVLNYADKIQIGTGLASKVYVGSTQAWPLFKPTDISGLKIWLDASKLNLLDGQSATSWTNIAPGGAQPTIAAGAVFRTNALNTIMPCVRITQGTGKIRFTGTGVDKDYTIVYVGRKWSTRVGRVIAARGDVANILVGFHGAEGDVCYIEGWITNPQSPPGTTLWKMYSADSTSTAVARFFANGVLNASSAATPAKGWGGTLCISGYEQDGQECDCEIAEVIMYNRKLSDAERQSVEKYLREKWISGLLWKPTDLGVNLTAWFDSSDLASVQQAGAGVNNWVNRGVGGMTLSQATDAQRPTYLSAGGVNIANGQGMNGANGPASFDMAIVSRPLAGSWRSLLRSATGNVEMILEDATARLGAYVNGPGFTPATVGRVSPINMTSDTAPSPYVVTSNGYNTFHAFDNVATTHWHSNDPIQTAPAWLKIDLGSQQNVGWYRYQARHDGSTTVPYQQWKSWVLEGSNNDSTWTLVDTVTNVADYALGEARNYSCDVYARFRYWRWTITAGTGYTPPYAAAAALELHDGLIWNTVDGLAYARLAQSTAPQYSRDGGALTSTGVAFPTGSVAPIYFGCYMGAPPSQAWGLVKELIFVPYNSPDATRQKIEGYLAHKWGLDNLLPAGHPYKSAPP